MKILQRYILRELLLNFSFALTIITTVFFIAVSVQTLYRFQQLSFLFVVQLFPQLVPFSLGYTVPMSALIGVVLTYGRLSADNEITAIRTSGMHLFRLLHPGVVLGLFTVVLCYYLQAAIIPYCHYKKRTVTRDAVSLLISGLDARQDSIAFGNFHMSWEDRDEEGRFVRLLLALENGEGGTTQRVFAESGLVYVDGGLVRFDLSGWKILIDHTGELSSPGPDRSLEEARAAPESPPPDLDKKNLLRGSTGLPFFELDLDAAEDRRSSRSFPSGEHFRLSIEIDSLFPSVRATRRTRELSLSALKERRDEQTSPLARAELDTEIQTRYSLSVAGLTFVLLGMPLGILFRKGNRLLAFLVSFLLVMVLYYPLLMFGEAFAETGRLHPAVAMWSANLVVGGLGVVFILRVLRQ